MTSESAECPICGGLMFGLHCKLVCRNCGYREDCSDLFPVEQAEQGAPSDIEGEGCERRQDRPSS